MKNPWAIGITTVAFLAIIVSVIGYNYWGWFAGNNNTTSNGAARPYCQCTHSKGQCGRDQYCDGCNCITESNRTIITPFIVRPNPTPVPTPIPVNPPRTA